MRFKLLLNLTLSVFITTLVSACGNSSTSPQAIQTPYESVNTASYKVEYIPVTTATVGKSTFKIRLSNLSDGKLVSGKMISLMPTMHMSASANHSTPFETITGNGDGTYSGNIYYLMQSTTGDKWELKFTIDGETATFNPVVAAATTTTALVKLKGINDKIGSMTMGAPPVSRTYQLFNDGITGNNVKLFISAGDDSMMMKFPAFSIDTTLHDPMNEPLTVDGGTSSVQVSSDGITWVSATDDGSGHWSATGLSGLVSGGGVWVKLTVNGEQKTTDGFVVGAANGYQKFNLM